MSDQSIATTTAPKSGGLEYKWKVLISVVFGLFMVILDATVINVALKTLQGEFHANTNEVQWVISIYTLAVGIATPLSGFLGDRFGAKRIYMLGLALFVAGSLLCGISTYLPPISSTNGNLLLLIIFRAVQGVGGGIALPLGTAMLFGSFERKEQGLAFGIFGIVLVFAPAIGPLLGGWLVDQNLWQWIFFINLPIGALGLTLAGLWLKEQRSPRKPKVDVLGILFSSIGFGAILYGASSAGEQGVGWGDARTLTAFAVGAVGLIAFAITELRVQQPLLDLRLFKIRNFLIANIVGWVGVVALFGAEFLLPLYLQILRGKSAFDTGLVLLPLAIAAGFSIPISGFIADKIGPRVLVVLGFAILAFNTWQLAQIDLNTDIGFIAFLLVIRGVALGLVIQNTNVAALRDIPLIKLARGTSLVNSTQQIIQSVGVAALATVLSSAVTIQIPAQFLNGSVKLDPSKIPPQFAAQFHQFQSQYIDGLHAAYNITLVIAIVTTLLAMMLPGWPGKYGQHAQPTTPAADEQPQPALAMLYQFVKEMVCLS